MEYKISVIIPVYNCEKYLERAVNSILNQPCSKEIEILIVDDGSKDHSGEICDRLAAEHANIRVFHKENGGVSSARNLGIENAAGKYLAFCDADDWWEPNFFDESLSAELADPDQTDVWTFSWRAVNNNVTLQKIYKEPEADLFFDSPSLCRMNAKCHCAFFFRTKYILAQGFRYPIAKIHEDTTFAELCVSFAHSLKRRSKLMYTYYQNFSSCVHTQNNMTKFVETVKALNIGKKIFEQKGVAYEIDRTIVSHAVDSLPLWCMQNKYHDVRKFIQDNDCFLKGQNVLPWKNLMKQYSAWQKHPKWFWFKSRLYPGLPSKIKHIAYRIPFLRRPLDYLWNVWGLKWDKITVDDRDSLE